MKYSIQFMKLPNLNTSYLQQFIVALIIGLWLSFFLILIAPFDASDLSLRIRITLLPMYGLVASLTYLSLIPLQNLIQKQIKKWDILSETAFIFIFTLICLVGSYLYYKSSIVNGLYNLPEFVFGQYYPIFLIMLPIIILSRWFLFKKTNHSIPRAVILKGDNKFDILKIELSNLICINSASNYIEVNYLEDRELKKKLLRTTLTHIHCIAPSLLKVHRSYLINPAHFKEWKDSKTLSLTKMEVPVSKKYKNDVLSLSHSSLKPNDSTQTYGKNFM